ncbi:MAG: class I SAM-dependent methyltransferase [Gammaproteobacteria bacterium]|nr:class I SAM-dependent methyltransferase [Gammaproteobacteria bacterium]
MQAACNNENNDGFAIMDIEKLKQQLFKQSQQLAEDNKQKLLPLQKHKVSDYQISQTRRVNYKSFAFKLITFLQLAPIKNSIKIKLHRLIQLRPSIPSNSQIKGIIKKIPLMGQLITFALFIRKFERLETQLVTLNEQNQNLHQRLMSLQMTKTMVSSEQVDNNSELLFHHQLSQNIIDQWYLDFEDKFRGSAENIIKQLENYWPHIEALFAQQQQHSRINSIDELQCLDLGAGRGEWLSLLKQKGIHDTIGVDLNTKMVELCQQQQLMVIASDALEYLMHRNENSCHLITAFHLIEHLSFEQRMLLFTLSLKVLKPGGMILFETPNPENITVGSYSFYLDPTHNNPLPPISIEFLAQQTGYEQIMMLRKNPREEVGESMPLTEQWFKSPVDYAILAKKPL